MSETFAPASLPIFFFLGVLSMWFIDHVWSPHPVVECEGPWPVVFLLVVLTVAIVIAELTLAQIAY